MTDGRRIKRNVEQALVVAPAVGAEKGELLRGGCGRGQIHQPQAVVGGVGVERGVVDELGSAGVESKATRPIGAGPQIHQRAIEQRETAEDKAGRLIFVGDGALDEQALGAKPCHGRTARHAGHLPRLAPIHLRQPIGGRTFGGGQGQVCGRPQQLCAIGREVGRVPLQVEHPLRPRLLVYENGLPAVAVGVGEVTAVGAEDANLGGEQAGRGGIRKHIQSQQADLPRAGVAVNKANFAFVEPFVVGATIGRGQLSEAGGGSGGGGGLRKGDCGLRNGCGRVGSRDGRCGAGDGGLGDDGDDFGRGGGCAGSRGGRGRGRHHRHHWRRRGLGAPQQGEEEEGAKNKGKAHGN